MDNQIKLVRIRPSDSESQKSDIVGVSFDLHLRNSMRARDPFNPPILLNPAT